jgi:hypothetical protein
MATANQIKYRIGQAKKKLVKLNRDLILTKVAIKKLEDALKKAKVIAKVKVVKKVVAKKKVASVKKALRAAVLVKRAAKKAK